MKNTYNFLIFISIIFTFQVIGCDKKADLHNSVPDDTTPIKTRGDCNDCPGANECCCVIEWLSGAQGDFSICGTSDGDAVTCTTQSLCDNDIDGLEHSFFTLSGNTGETREEFCMDEDMAFRIQRLDQPGNGTVYARVSCTTDQGSPQWKLVSFTADGRAFYDVDEGCLLTECN